MGEAKPTNTRAQDVRQWRLDRITRLTLRRNDDVFGSKLELILFSISTPLMHSRRLPVSVRALGRVTLSAFRVSWSCTSRATGPIVSPIDWGTPVVMARCTAHIVWYSTISVARNQPSSSIAPEMWSRRLRPQTTRAQKLIILCTRAIRVTPHEPYTLIQYRTIDSTRA